MTDFTPDEMMVIRVAMLTYKREMTETADMWRFDTAEHAHYAGKAIEANQLYDKLIEMDLHSIRMSRKALDDELTREAVAETPREFWANPDAHADDPMPEWNAREIKHQTGNGLNNGMTYIPLDTV